MKACINILLLYVIIGVQPLLAQRTHSFSAGIGTTYYYGDLTDKFNNSLIRPAGSFSYSKYIMPNLRFRAGLSYGEVGAADAQAIDDGRIIRNLHFKSHIAEIHGALVYEFLRDKNFGNSWQDKPHFTPYVFAGVALFSFSPKARLDGTWYNLQPLGTEGQYIPGFEGPEPYSLIQFSAPFGVGASLRLSDYTGISFEIGYRSTGTDFIDDISTFYPNMDDLREVGGDIAVQLSNRSKSEVKPGDKRGHSGAKDSYFFTMFSINYYLNRYASRN